jgi:2-aminobenzoate-CoA ligase
MTYTAHLDTFARDNLPPKHLLPEFRFTLPELQYPERINCCSEFLDRWVTQGSGDRICLVTPQETITYAALQARVNRLCNVLVGDLGVVPGNRVLLSSPNTAQMVTAYLAVLKVGAVAVATMPLLRAREIAYPLNKAKIALALCDHRLGDEVTKAGAMAPGLKRIVRWGTETPDELDRLMARASPEFTAVETASDDVCLIGFTSGTTGEPKGTMHFHRDLLAICDSYGKHILCATPDDRFIGSPPMAFTFGLGIVLFPMRVGASIALPEKAGPDDLPAAIEKYRATICFSAPTAYRAMLPTIAQHDLSSLRKCVSAGETLPKDTYEAWLRATGLRLMDGIGATEMLHIFIAAKEGETRAGATGFPVPGYEAKVIDDGGNELPAGTPGRLAVRGPTGCRYLADERQRKYVANGWNVTGDTYVKDAQGYFCYQARSDDMIVSAGYNIAGPEVEAALLAHPAVAECGVIGAADRERGQIVKAFVVLRPGFSSSPELTKVLQEHVKTEIAPYKYPRAIAYVSALPRTQTGKLQRFQLRQLEQAAMAPRQASA